MTPNATIDPGALFGTGVVVIADPVLALAARSAGSSPPAEQAA
jgi:hypothetical protein